MEHNNTCLDQMENTNLSAFYNNAEFCDVCIDTNDLEIEYYSSEEEKIEKKNSQDIHLLEGSSKNQEIY